MSPGRKKNSGGESTLYDRVLASTARLLDRSRARVQPARTRVEKARASAESLTQTAESRLQYIRHSYQSAVSICMRASRISSFCIVVAATLFTAAVSAGAQTNSAGALTVERIFGSREFSGDFFGP